MSAAAIELHSASAGYDGDVVLHDVDLRIGHGELVALVGPNGAGKSTLLKLLVGLLRPKAGSVEILGQRPGTRTREIAYLPQAEAVHWEYPLRVEDVVLMGLIPRLGVGRRASGADRKAARAALARVGADDLARRPVQALSGGQRQRVLLARTLVADPQVLLLDEPATAVDPTTEDQLMGILEDLARDGHTVVVATHDLAGVLAHFPRVVSLNGRVIADGSVDMLRDEQILRATYGGHRATEPHLIADEHHA